MYEQHRMKGQRGLLSDVVAIYVLQGLHRLHVSRQRCRVRVVRHALRDRRQGIGEGADDNVLVGQWLTRPRVDQPATCLR
jgi:hypothetical protein